MNKQISVITTAAIMLTALVTVALYHGREANAQAANMTNATAAAGANMTNATAAAGANMTQPLVPANGPK